MREKFEGLFSGVNVLQKQSSFFCSLVLFSVLAIWFFFSYFQWIGDSEFWPISLAGHWDQAHVHPSLLYKATFHGTLSWIHLWDLSNVIHIKIAKALYAGLGVALIFVLYQILKSKLGSAKALILVLFLLSNSMAFSNLGLIRSDNLATLLLLILFGVLSKIPPANWKSLFLVFVMGSIPIFFSTPKSIYGILVLWSYLFFYIKPSLRLRFLNGSMALLIVFLLALTGLGKVGFISGIYDSLISALAFHLHVQTYYSEFLSRFNRPYFLKDLVFYIALVSLFIWQIFLFVQKNTPRRPEVMAYTVMGIMTWTAFWVQRPSLPFFLASLLPLIILSLVPALSKIKTQWLMSLLVGSLFYSTVWGHHELFFVSNKNQFTTLDKIETQLTYCSPNSLIFDALAIFPSKSRIHSLMAYISNDDDIALQGGIQEFQKTKPELVILSGKIVSVSHLFSGFVIENYMSVGKGYWLRKDLVRQCSLSLEDLPMSWKIFGYTTDKRL